MVMEGRGDFKKSITAPCKGTFYGNIRFERGTTVFVKISELIESY